MRNSGTAIVPVVFKSMLTKGVEMRKFTKSIAMTIFAITTVLAVQSANAWQGGPSGGPRVGAVGLATALAICSAT